MSNAKDEVIQILQKLPADATDEDIQYHIYVREKGLQDAQAGRTLSQFQVEEKMTKRKIGVRPPLSTLQEACLP
jgi:heat shock protein HspQ